MRRWLYFMISLMALGSIGSWAFSEARSMRDRSDVARMTEKMKTVCVGRHLVDVPVEAHVSFSGGALDGFSVDSVAESKTEFLQRILAREAEIVARGTASDGSGGLLEARDLHVVGLAGRTFVFGRNRAYWFENGRRVDDEWVAVEIHANTEGLSVSLSAKAVDMARIASAEALFARLPYLSLELQTGKSDTPSGKPVDTSLHEDAQLALWDRVASSIRPRNPDTTNPRPNSGPADPRRPAAL